MVMLLQLVSTLASLYLPTVNAAIIDDGVARGDTDTIVRLGGVMLGVTALQVVCAVGAVYFGSRAGMSFGRDLRAAMFHHVTTFSEHETSRFGAPTLLTRTTNDVQQIQVLVQMTFTVLVTAPIMCVGGLIMAIHQDAGLSWLLLVSVPVLGLANGWIIRHMLPIFRNMQRLIDGINRVMREQLSGIRVIRAFAREPFEQNRFRVANTDLANTALAAGRWQALMLPVTTLTINLSSVALIWFGGRRIDAGQMQVGSLIAFLSYFMLILMAVLMATIFFVVLPRAAACAERITEVLSTPPAIANPDHPREPAATAGLVELVAAGFCYPGADRPVLEDVSFVARPGTTTAVVGSTGSGKSTLVSLICRLYDVTSGRGQIDGVDVRDYHTERLWSAHRAGAAAGLPVLRHGGRQPALRAEPTPPRTRCGRRCGWRAPTASSRAHADGLEMRVAQGGINFSGGQRQRLAIARAVIRAPAVYLFDDALSALDVHTDARVRDQLREVAADSTVIIVAQRISTVMGADQVIVLDDGHVVGAGTHETLLTECPAYAQFADSQSLGVGRGRSTVSGPMRGAMRMQQAPAERSRDFRGTAVPAGRATDTAARVDHGGDRIVECSGSPSA